MFNNKLRDSASGHGGRLFGLSPNVVWLGVVSFLNDLSSDMIFPFIPIFLTSVLGASLTFVGLVEGIADATSSVLKIFSGWLSDKIGKRKTFIVFGYSFSAVSKPILAAAIQPWHVLFVRFLDRVGKGTRDAPRDALISISTEQEHFGRAFGFHRAMDTLGAALGPLAAFVILPFIHQNYRTLFLLSFVASFFAVLILIFFVREARANGKESGTHTSVSVGRPIVTDIRVGIRGNSGEIREEPSRGRLTMLGLPFFLFLGVATLASLGKASEAFLILKAREVGLAITLLPIIYFVFNITFALFSTPVGAMADRLGKRNTFFAGLLVFIAVYLGFSTAESIGILWVLFILYGFYAALTEGVGRAIVADLVPSEIRATAFGIFNACTGIALLPASFVFGYLDQHFGSRIAFYYGALAAFAAALGFLILQNVFRRRHSSP